MTKLDEKVDQLSKQIEADLRAIELDVTTSYTLADAIREGSSVTIQANGWGDGETACALTSAAIAGRARGYL